MEIFFKNLKGDIVESYNFGVIFYNEQKKTEINMIVEFKDIDIATFTVKQIKHVFHLFSNNKIDKENDIVKKYHVELLNKRMGLSVLEVVPSTGILRPSSLHSTSILINFIFSPPSFKISKGFVIYLYKFF
jgi:hypothetical protein